MGDGEAGIDLGQFLMKFLDFSLKIGLIYVKFLLKFPLPIYQIEIFIYCVSSEILKFNFKIITKYLRSNLLRYSRFEKF